MLPASQHVPYGFHENFFGPNYPDNQFSSTALVNRAQASVETEPEQVQPDAAPSIYHNLNPQEAYQKRMSLIDYNYLSAKTNAVLQYHVDVATAAEEERKKLFEPLLIPLSMSPMQIPASSESVIVSAPASSTMEDSTRAIESPKNF
jgi:hypothetical protein